MDVEEIRDILKDVGDKLDLDMEIIEYLIRDIVFSNRFIIIELEDDFDKSISQEFYQYFDDSKVMLANSADDFPSDISSDDCVFAISNSGEDSGTIDLVKRAKSKKAYVYVLSSNFQSALASMADSFIHIKDSSNFKENALLLIDTIKTRINYYYGSDEYQLDGSQPLNIMVWRERASIPRVGKPVSSHFEKKSMSRHNKIFLAFSLIVVAVLVLAYFAIKFILESYFPGVYQFLWDYGWLLSALLMVLIIVFGLFGDRIF